VESFSLAYDYQKGLIQKGTFDWGCVSYHSTIFISLYSYLYIIADIFPWIGNMLFAIGTVTFSGLVLMTNITPLRKLYTNLN